MASPNGSGSGDLTHFERLQSDPQAHHIFFALRIIEAQFPDAPRMGNSNRPREDAVRLGQEARMAFPPTTIHSFKAPGAEPGQLINRFFGFFGPHGPLPSHLTEYARERQINHRDPSFVAFANMLTHRMTSLLYRAWVTGQPAVDFDRGDDGTFERQVAALAGHLGVEMRGRDAMPDRAKRHYAGLLGQGVRNAEGLLSLLCGFFHVPFRLEEFIGCWLELEPDDRWQLGQGGGLGQSTSIGTRVWTRNAKFRLVVGPVSLEDYERLLPGGGSLEKMAAIVRNYVGDTLDWDVNVILAGDQVPAAQLGGQTRLGQTSWSGTRKTNKDAADLFLQPNDFNTRAA